MPKRRSHNVDKNDVLERKGRKLKLGAIVDPVTYDDEAAKTSCNESMMMTLRISDN